MNAVLVAGFAGGAPEISEKSARFSVAVRGSKKQVMWIRCICFGDFYKEFAKKYIDKGVFVCVSGQFQIEDYEVSGVVSHRFSVLVEHITLGGISSKGLGVDVETGEIIEEREKSKGKK